MGLQVKVGGRRWVWAAVWFLGFFLAGAAGANTLDQSVLHPAIPLLDEQGRHVLDSGQPYSSRTSCGTAGCHDYDSITHAFHMEQGRDEASDDFGRKRNGLTQLVSPGYFGGYNCMGGNNPDMLAKKKNAGAADFADRGTPGWIQRCSSCHSGGGWAEKDRNGNRYDQVDPATVAKFDGDYYNRGTDENNRETSLDVVSRWNWKKSGVIENDCLMCHIDFRNMKVFDPLLNVPGASGTYDQYYELRRTQLLEPGFFRYAGTAILELANLKHPAGVQTDINLVTFSKHLETDDHGMMHSATPAYMLDLNASGMPIINWNVAAFDANRKVRIPMLRFSGSSNCMQCHRTANSRRGFYGIGDDHKGPLTADYQGDVHLNKAWTEPNGETRAIRNCNACHARGYYKPAYSNVDLDANHNFPKGNSDNDIRNDLDFAPGPKTCVYCHDTAPNPAIPSGHKSMLDAHRERWKLSGDLAGYPKDALSRITQTHLDVVGCETCHITGVMSGGKPLQILYRYRETEDGKLRISPFKAAPRYYWKEKRTGRVLTQTERNSVYRFRTDAGKNYADLIDTQTGQVLGTFAATLAHGRWQAKEPSDYAGFVTLKKAYDAVMKSKGIADADTALVWTEVNSYMISHNTRAAVSSVQCAQCHAKKQDGTFSALVSPTGVLGEANAVTISALSDPRLISEGIVILDRPYMKAENGSIRMNVSDLLYYTKINPSLSALDYGAATAVAGQLARTTTEEGFATAGLSAPDGEGLALLASRPELFVYAPRQGVTALRQVALVLPVDAASLAVAPGYRAEVAIAEADVARRAAKSGAGGLASDVYSLEMRNAAGEVVHNFGDARVLVKLPYDGTSTKPEAVQVVTSVDGSSWTTVDAANIAAIKPQTADTPGYVAFWTDHFSLYAVADRTKPTIESEAAATSSGGGGGGYALPLLALAWRLRRRIKH